MATGGFIICDYKAIRNHQPEFKSIMKDLENQLVNYAESKWGPLKSGTNVLGTAGKGTMHPKSGEFGLSTIMPQLFQAPSWAAGVLATMETWRTWVDATTQTVPGHNTLMQGSAGSGMIYEDYMVGIAGLALLDKVQRISEIKMQIGDRKLPRINIEECMAYEQPCIIFEDGFVLDEEESFHLYTYNLTYGWNRLKLIGLQANRVPNKMQVSDTGAALL